MANAGLSTRPIWSQINVAPYIANQSDCLTTTIAVGGGVLGKRLLRKAMIGSIVPVIAMTHRKKNSQRGPTVGRVMIVKAINPPQPMINKNIAAGRKLATRGEVFDVI